MKARVQLEIHREDHTQDALGLVFLDAVQAEKSLDLIRSYVGHQARLREAQLEDGVLRVEAEVRQFPEESQNLLRLARDMTTAGRMKGAVGQLEEALSLSPWSPQALKALGRIYHRHRERAQARYYLVRAREVAPDDLDVLRLLAEIAVQEERKLQARSYIEQILRQNPADRRARVALSRLIPDDAREIRASIAAGSGQAQESASDENEAPSTD